MSDEQQRQVGQKPAHNRRASDRGAREDGIQAGGRRKTDRPHAMPRSSVAKIAIACSFFFSTGLLAWAFTLPFRSGSLDDGAKLKNLPEAELANLEYEARLSSQAYVQYTRDIDRRLLDRVRDKEGSPSQGPSRPEVRKNWEKRMQARKQQLEVMREEFGGKEFKEGTIEWQNQQDLEKVIDDAPPEA